MSGYSSSSANNNLRCFKPGLGRIVSKEQTVGEGGGQWSKENVPDKCVTKGGQIDNNDVHDVTSEWDLHSFTVKQHSGIVLSTEIRRDKKSGHDISYQGNLELPLVLQKLPLRQNISQR